MNSSLAAFPLEEIHGFISPGEYSSFVEYISQLVAASLATEVPVNADYSEGELCGGRWFQDAVSGQIWRLIEPDFPFRGLWEPVRKDKK